MWCVLKRHRFKIWGFGQVPTCAGLVQLHIGSCAAACGAKSARPVGLNGFPKMNWPSNTTFPYRPADMKHPAGGGREGQEAPLAVRFQYACCGHFGPYAGNLKACARAAWHRRARTSAHTRVRLRARGFSRRGCAQVRASAQR